MFPSGYFAPQYFASGYWAGLVEVAIRRVKLLRALFVRQKIDEITVRKTPNDRAV